MDQQTELIINELRHEIHLLNTKVAQLTGELQLKVDKTDIVNQINISQEGIRISGDKIAINQDSMITENIKMKEGN